MQVAVHASGVRALLEITGIGMIQVWEKYYLALAATVIIFFSEIAL